MVLAFIYSEEQILKEKQDYFAALAEETQLIFADGGSSDGSFKEASAVAETVISSKGRAIQMNMAAEMGQAEILFFFISIRMCPRES